MKYQIRKKHDNKLVAEFDKEVNALKWFHNHYPYSFNTALSLGEENLYEIKDDGTEVRVRPIPIKNGYQFYDDVN